MNIQSILIPALLLGFLFPKTTIAQTNISLEAYFTFEGNLNDVTGNTSNTGLEVGTPTYTCGISGQGLLLDGTNDQVRILSSAGISREFDTEDFTLSLYFKPVGINGTQYLFSKRDTACTGARQFAVTYFPGAGLVKTFLAQDEDKDVELNNIINNSGCWQHLTVVRDDIRIKVYINGEFQSERGTASRVNVETPGDIYIGGGDCLGGIETPFSGIIDEVRIYDRALSSDEIRGLYFSPDKILTSDTIVFLGTSVDVRLGTSCGDSFTWTPPSSVMSPNDAEPTIDADEVGAFVYTVQVKDQVSTCVASDSFRVTVVDPNSLPCKVALANAFTPNLDNLNDSYGLSNPFAISDLISFEIFDRWGGKVFITNDAFAQWDGTFQGEKVNPGVFLWRAIYRCSGEEKSETGTVTVMR